MTAVRWEGGWGEQSEKGEGIKQKKKKRHICTTVWQLPEGKGDGGRWKREEGINHGRKRLDFGW